MKLARNFTPNSTQAPSSAGELSYSALVALRLMISIYISKTDKYDI